MATPKDAGEAYDRYMGVARKRGYTVGITGSTLFGDGNDIDLLAVASAEDDVKISAAGLANEFLAFRKHILYYEQHDDGSAAWGAFIQTDDTVIDFYVVGPTDREMEQ